MIKNIIQIYLPIIISVISLILSLFTIVSNKKSERFDIDIHYVKWFGNSKIFFVWLIISNNSILPVTITSIDLICKSNCKNAVSRGEKHLVYSREGNDACKYYSTDYPITINGLSGYGGYFHFFSEDSFNNFEDRNVIISVNTNRGIKKTKFYLSFGDNIFRVIQSKAGELPKFTSADGNDIVFQLDGDGSMFI